MLIKVISNHPHVEADHDPELRIDVTSKELFNSPQVNSIHMASVAKIVELIGTSDDGWEAAAQAAVKEARKTIRGISGIEVVDMTAKVDTKSGKIVKYRATVKIAFGVDDER